MASIRRTLSPANSERHRVNGAVGSSLSMSSPHRLFDASAKSSKKKVFISRSLLYSSFLFFALGMVVGFSTSDKMIRESVNSIPSQDNRGDFPPVDSKPVDLITFSAISVNVPKGIGMQRHPPKKLLIVVTPTYVRAAQAYFLNRLGQVLALVPPPLLWLVIEAEESATGETAELLRRTGVMYRHLVTGSKRTGANKDRGVHQRNTALEHIEKHRLDGIVYLADDDNAYSLELFSQLREVERFGTWPVAMLAQSKNKAILEGAVCNGSRVTGWHTNEKSKRVRRFHVDMSGFAFNSTILWDPKRWRRFSSSPIRQLDTVKEGFQETTFIWQLLENESQMEGLSNGCSKVLNWHLHLNVRGAFPSGWLLA